MKTIFLDPEFKCHLTNDGTMLEVQTDVFDIYTSKAVECFRFVPKGHTWIGADGRERHGEFIQAFRSGEVITAYQEQYEADAAQLEAEMLADLDAAFREGVNSV